MWKRQKPHIWSRYVDSNSISGLIILWMILEEHDTHEWVIFFDVIVNWWNLAFWTTLPTGKGTNDNGMWHKRRNEL